MVSFFGDANKRGYGLLMEGYKCCKRDGEWKNGFSETVETIEE